jgi:hypothetical protein
MTILPIDKSTSDRFVREKHYSRSPSIFWAGFGLEIDGLIQGVIVYGQPSPPIQKHAFNDRNFRLYELSRLVVQTKEKNAASFLIAGSLKMLEKNSAVVSYADSEHGHCGIVYQATNWLYTGATMSHDHVYIVDGVRTHPMSLRDKGITNPKEWAKKNGIKTVKPMVKHRYFYLNASSKSIKKTMLSKLKYPVFSQYPKCDKKMYDDGPILTIKSMSQSSLF